MIFATVKQFDEMLSTACAFVTVNQSDDKLFALLADRQDRQTKTTEPTRQKEGQEFFLGGCSPRLSPEKNRTGVSHGPVGPAED